MKRQIEPGIDSYLDKVFKLIPAEITAGFLAGQSLIFATPRPEELWWLLLLFAFVLTLITPLYLMKIQNVTSVSQIFVSTLSFPIWAANISASWFAHLGPAVPALGLLLIVWVLFVPLVLTGGE